MKRRTSIFGAAMLAALVAALVACGTPATSGSGSASEGAAASAGPDTADWERIVIADYGFAIQLPPNWESLDLTSENLAALMEGVSSSFPDSTAFQAQVEAILQSGGALFAFDGDTSHSVPDFRTNLNVIVEEIPAGATLDDVIQANRDGIVEFLHPDGEINVEMIDHATGEAALLTYELTTAGEISIHQTQLYVVADGKAYYLTMSRPKSLTELQEATLAILATFELLP
jgi:hypothetical protein